VLYFRALPRTELRGGLFTDPFPVVPDAIDQFQNGGTFWLAKLLTILICSSVVGRGLAWVR
jgi:hypothetical protein